MILLQQHIELKIYHNNKLRKYKVIELLKDDEGISFSIYHDGDFVFCLIPTMTDFLSFKLKDPSRLKNIELSLYSI